MTVGRGIAGAGWGGGLDWAGDGELLRRRSFEGEAREEGKAVDWKLGVEGRPAAGAREDACSWLLAACCERSLVVSLFWMFGGRVL